MIAKPPTIEGHFRAVERVERLLKGVTAALDQAGVPYAVIGGCAVAAWVQTIDDGAVRATKDVDLLIRRGDIGRAAQALKPLNLIPETVMGIHDFVDQADPRPSQGCI